MKRTYSFLFRILCLGIVTIVTPAWGRVKVVTTLPDYADIVKAIGQDQVEVTAIVRGDQDAHFIRPKPSFALALRKVDLLVSTGLDLELWLQTVIDNAGNRRIRSGQEGYVAAVKTLLNINEEFGRPGCRMAEGTKVMWLVEAGDFDQAYAIMEKLDEQGNLDVAYLASNHEGYEHFKSYPGYVELLKKYKLPYPKD